MTTPYTRLDHHAPLGDVARALHESQTLSGLRKYRAALCVGLIMPRRDTLMRRSSDTGFHRGAVDRALFNAATEEQHRLYAFDAIRHAKRAKLTQHRNDAIRLSRGRDAANLWLMHRDNPTPATALAYLYATAGL